MVDFSGISVVRRIPRDVVRDVFVAPEKVGLTISPLNHGIDAVAPQSGPVSFDGLRVPIISFVRSDIVSDVLTAFEKVKLAITPVHGSCDVAIPNPKPVAFDGLGIIGFVILKVVADVFAAFKEKYLTTGTPVGCSINIAVPKARPVAGYRHWVARI